MHLVRLTQEACYERVICENSPQFPPPPTCTPAPTCDNRELPRRHTVYGVQLPPAGAARLRLAVGVQVVAQQLREGAAKVREGAVQRRKVWETY